MKSKIWLICLALLVIFLAGCNQNNKTDVNAKIQNITAPKIGEIAGKIVFHSDRQGKSYDIYTINADGTDLQKITNSNYTNNSPQWGPDSKSILLDATVQKGEPKEILLIKNGDIISLVKSENNSFKRPKWLPASNEILFERAFLAEHELIFYDLLTSKENVILKQNTHINADVSPDGKKIAFNNTNNNKKSDIFIADINGANIKKIAYNKNKSWSDWGPVWSPDGRKVAFTSMRSRKSDIYIMNADGSNQQRITNDKYINDYPAWSPDGTKIVYSSYRHGKSWAGAELIIIDIDSKKQWQLTKTVQLPSGDLSEDLEPDWSK